MLAIAAGSTAAGFLTTVLLLRMDVRAMWVRYGVSVAVAYGAFLALIGWWAGYYGRHQDEAVALAALRGERPPRKADFNALEVLGDIADLLGEEIGLTFLALLLIAGVVYLAAVLAPEWIAELVLDAVCGAVLYRGLREIEPRHWMRSTLRRTAAPFACLLVLFVAAGVACSAIAPEAKSIGGVVRHLTSVR